MLNLTLLSRFAKTWSISRYPTNCQFLATPFYERHTLGHLSIPVRAGHTALQCYDVIFEHNPQYVVTGVIIN